MALVLARIWTGCVGQVFAAAVFFIAHSRRGTSPTALVTLSLGEPRSILPLYSAQAVCVELAGLGAPLLLPRGLGAYLRPADRNRLALPRGMGLVRGGDVVPLGLFGPSARGARLSDRRG